MTRLPNSDREPSQAGERWRRPAAPPAAQRALPNAPLVRAIFGALMAAGPQAAQAGWRAAGNAVVNVQRSGARTCEVRFEGARPEDAWRTVASVTPLALDLMAMLLAPPAGGLMRARVIGAREVLEAKGYRRYGDERRAVERQLAVNLEALRCMGAEGRAERLFKLSPIEHGHCEFIYEPSPWLQQLALTAPMEPLADRILTFDHRVNRGADVLAKKLAIYLTLSLGEQAQVVRRVRSVLQAVGVPPQPPAGVTGRGGRLADRFDEALLRLQDHGLFVIRYRGGGGSAGTGVDRVKGWLNRWLEMELVIARAPEPAPSPLPNRPAPE